MEEADALLIITLKQIGCDIGDDVSTLVDFASDHIVAGVALSLNVIAGTDFRPKLPANVATRHRVCTTMANKIKELGYNGEVGYNQLLYPNVKDTRRLLQFLIHRLPRHEEEQVEEALSGSALLSHRIASRMAEWVQAPWSPPGAARTTASFRSCPLELPPSTGSAAPEAVAFASDKLPHVWRQSWRQGAPVGPSLLERNTQAVEEASRREMDWGADGLDDASKSSEAKKSALAAAARRAFADAGGGKVATGTLQQLLASMGGGHGGARDKGSAFAHQTEFGQEQAAPEVVASVMDTTNADDDQVSEQKRKEDELAALNAELAELEAKIAERRREAAARVEEVRQDTTRVTTEKAKTEGLEREFLVRKKTLQMLPESAKYIVQLQEICSATVSKLMKLAAEWETHRRPLLDSIRQHKESHAKRKARARGLITEMKEKRAAMSGMMDDLRAKDDKVRHLAAEYERMPKEVNRSVYTRRIMELIRQVRKQKSEIAKIIGSIRDVQRDINVVSDKLARTTSIAEDNMYKSASNHRNDPAYVQAYRTLTQVRESFASIVDTITKAGHAENEQRDFESKVEALLLKNTDKNMARVLADIKQVRADNQVMMQKLRSG